MTFHGPLNFLELMFRAYVRNMMFSATLPYHLAQDMRRNRACEGVSEGPRTHRSKDMK